MDALSQTLGVVRLVGAIFINAKFTAPWAYQSPQAAAAAPLLEPGAERVVIFHLITEGECYVAMADEPPVHLRGGDVVVFPQGDAHLMSSAPGVPPARGARLEQVLARRPRQLIYGGGGKTTRLVCGYLACDLRLARLLFAGLPALLKVDVRGSSAGAWLEASLRYALAEARSPRPGGAGVLAKLAEVLFIEVLRLYMNEQSAGRMGWLAAVGDRIVGGALNALHARPAHAWTLEELAQSAETSRSVLAEAVCRTRRQHAHAVPDAMAHVARSQSLARQQRTAVAHRGARGLSDGHGVQPGVPPRIRRAAGGVAAYSSPACDAGTVMTLRLSFYLVLVLLLGAHVAPSCANTPPSSPSTPTSTACCCRRSGCMATRLPITWRRCFAPNAATPRQWPTAPTGCWRPAAPPRVLPRACRRPS